MNSTIKHGYRIVFSNQFAQYVVRDPSGNIIYMGERARCEKYAALIMEYLKSPFG